MPLVVCWSVKVQTVENDGIPKWLTSCMDNRCRSVLPICMCVSVRSVPNWADA
jgi:hypothetical protein